MILKRFVLTLIEKKQIAKMEKRARDIIEDKYLSERTKRLKLKQLLNSQNVEKI